MKRAEILAELPDVWDVIVIGGGMTGAGVFREATQAGYRTLLLEQRDFAWGTSSRSGKLVHGGLRYLSQGQVKTTWHSVRERERLLRRYPGLVEELIFAIPVYSALSGLMLRTGLTVYDGMAWNWTHRRLDAAQLRAMVPGLNGKGLRGGFAFRDAQTDDARLVLRVIREGLRQGGTALNYIRVEELVRDGQGRVLGVTVREREHGEFRELRAQAVINATGVWADHLRQQLGAAPRLRKLRGSHLIIARSRLPIEHAVSFSHPEDQRPLYAMPWQGVTLVGTTDLDHELPLTEEPKMSRNEGVYLLAGLNACFPDLALQAGDVMASFAGVRPVLNTGKADPSREARDHVVWPERGMITVTGGKLTTFPLLARQALREAAKWLGSPPGSKHVRGEGGYSQGAADAATGGAGGEEALAVLAGRFGDDAGEILPHAAGKGWEKVPGTGLYWAELAWSAQCEQVMHLDDLLLRRTRLGLLLPQGGASVLEEIRAWVLPFLGWDEERWQREKAAYLALWQEAYSPQPLS